MVPSERPSRARYRSLLSAQETEKAIKMIKDFFQNHLARELHLRRITAPFFVEAGTGINDDLSGVERPVSFSATSLKGVTLEVVQSLAKWKRLALRDLKIRPGDGIYTDMNAIRPDETLDALHSLYVDQWDWERVIGRVQRDLRFLKRIVRKIYAVIRRTEHFIHSHYPKIRPALPDDLVFVHAQDLEDRYPGLDPRQREDALCRAHGAAFILGIGGALRSGRPHDGRAPDYDDWTTPTDMGAGLNGDIVVWNPVLERAFEISSMGIRVDERALMRQLEITGQTARRELFFHRELIAGRLPLSIGGGIGQSRLCMYCLRKLHIGEVQAGIWPAAIVEDCRARGIFLL
ncbi:MAG TPA: aspartate--ammonia ligase [Candidatus Aminicenantes bacterium]|jgi:aspartate-ammonia ligase (EC 6.3.1.1)|nr:aspartate--ammonia ligase [Acidobacteriota bacterium]HOF83830.1 aspartate--ammonia ligase [Candidatus Aminicenantes bacterium]HOS12180.1 aspartate--ammonia ligase [Candidatus Aminicenantes bacterium]HPL13886.1 aspartate--ammonia ligase [Candidatus Aminicenantes bacterium]